MVASIVSLLLAVFKAIPVLKEVWDSLLAEYLKSELANMKKENAAAIRKAIYEHDQRDLEKLLDPSRAGTPSGIDGVLPAGSLPPTRLPDEGKSTG